LVQLSIAAVFLQNKYRYMSEMVNEFNSYRERMNEVILSKNNLVMKRLWNLDTNTYDEGALDKKTKEMLGLVASMVLRCDDCIKRLEDGNDEDDLGTFESKGNIIFS